MKESFFVNSHLLEIITTIPVYNLSPEQEKKEILRHYRSLLRALKTKLKKGDKELVRTAFEMAADAHKTIRRKSGEPYILHPLAPICVAGASIAYFAGLGLCTSSYNSCIGRN